MISIVIPTLGKFDISILKYSLNQALKSAIISNIIIIDNSNEGNVQDKISILDDRLLYIKTYRNIYVNPAWNLGVSHCKSDFILLMNDDVYCDTIIYNIVCDYMLNNVGLCTVNSFDCLSLSEYQDKKHIKMPDENNNICGRKRGHFFCIKKSLWKDIPSGLDFFMVMISYLKPLEI